MFCSMKADCSAYRKALLAAACAVSLFSLRVKAQEDKPKFFRNEDGSVERRLEKVEDKLSSIEQRLASIEKALKPGPVNATTVSVPSGAATQVPPTWTGKNVRSQEGIWFNQMSDGSLRLCPECNQAQVRASDGSCTAGGCSNCSTGNCAYNQVTCNQPGCAAGRSDPSVWSASAGSAQMQAATTSGRPRLFGRLFGRVRGGGCAACGQ